MRTHCLFRLVLIALTLVTGAWTTIRLWPFEGYVTPINCDRIVPGMSRADVYHLLGGPGWRPKCGVGIPPGEDPEFWSGLGFDVRVDFDYDGQVIRIRRGPD